MIASIFALVGCGGTAGGATDVGDGGDETIWHLNNKQTRFHDVYFTDDEVKAGLEMMEQSVVIPDAERTGRDASGAKCWMVLDSDGMLRQIMWCGPLVTADGLDEWAPFAFGSEVSDKGQVIVAAPLLRDQVGTLTKDDTPRRPDGAKVPDSGKPGAMPQIVEPPTSATCQADGSIAHQDVDFKLSEADYLDVETTVKEQQPTAPGRPTQFMITHVISAWYDSANSGHVLRLSSTGQPDGPYHPGVVSLDPYLQNREQMEAGASSNQPLNASRGEGSVEIRGVEGGKVSTTVSRDTFTGEDTATIDITLTCR